HHLVLLSFPTRRSSDLQKLFAQVLKLVQLVIVLIRVDQSLFQPGQAKRNDPLPQQHHRDDSKRHEGPSGQAQNTGSRGGKDDDYQRQQGRSRTAQNKAEQFGFDNSIRDIGAKERQRISQKKQHQDNNDIGDVHQQQSVNRKFGPRTEQYGKWKRAQRRREHGNLQVAHTAACVTGQASLARALHVHQGDAG